MKKIIIYSILILLVSSCGSAKQPKIAPEEQEMPLEERYTEYQVKHAGESLASVAHRLSGSAANWRVLADLNPEIKDYHLKVGQVIRVPKNMIYSSKTGKYRHTPAGAYRRFPQPNQQNIPHHTVAPLPAVTLPAPQPAPTKMDEKYRGIRNELINEMLNE